jgi:hypothetical protein
MTVRHIAHYLTCPGCAAALRGDPPQPAAAARCALILDGDQDPPARCPHPTDGDSDWCEVHGEAIGEQLKLEDEADELTRIIAGADRVIATASAELRAHDRIVRARRSRGAPAAEIVTLKMRREELTAAIGKAIAGKAELETRLAVLRPLDGQG